MHYNTCNTLQSPPLSCGVEARSQRSQPAPPTWRCSPEFSSGPYHAPHRSMRHLRYSLARSRQASVSWPCCLRQWRYCSLICRRSTGGGARSVCWGGSDVRQRLLLNLSDPFRTERGCCSAAQQRTWTGLEQPSSDMLDKAGGCGNTGRVPEQGGLHKAGWMHALSVLVQLHWLMA